MGDTFDGWITTAEAAALAGCKPVTVRWWLKEGKVKGRKVGRDWLVNRASLIEHAEEMSRLGPAKHDPTRGGGTE
ncbi:MAG: helix-turn-helix domain-containing protein [Anaerolineae bacterium]|nr:helix-turn-helix domain-containing protein [Anaerolineae bacterium]